MTEDGIGAAVAGASRHGGEQARDRKKQAFNCGGYERIWEGRAKRRDAKSNVAPLSPIRSMAEEPVKRALSDVLFALAAPTGGFAVLVYGYTTSLAFGYAPGAASCHASLWKLHDDDRLWLVIVPAIHGRQLARHGIPRAPQGEP